MGDLDFLHTLKWLHEFQNYFFYLSLSFVSPLFQDFFSNQTHKAKFPFWFLETKGSTIDAICGL